MPKYTRKKNMKSENNINDKHVWDRINKWEKIRSKYP